MTLQQAIHTTRLLKGCRPVLRDWLTVHAKHEHALLEIHLQLELDEQRGVPPLAPRARALQQARASGDQQAQRQALIDLAAACVAMAARIPAPVYALDELQLRTTAPHLRRPAKKRARRRAAA